METKALEQRISELEKKVAKYEEFFANVDESIKKVICEHLRLDDDIEHYAGNYATLYWDDKSLGSVCIERFSDD